MVFCYGKPSRIISILYTKDWYKWFMWVGLFSTLRTLWGRYYYYYSHFTEEETEAQLGLTNLLKVVQLENNGARFWL